MSIDIRGLGNEATLSQIAKLAYGSGSTEKTSGGKGNIGILDGRVVKFNTHWRERGGAVSEEMRASCNELRLKLSGIATAMLAASPNATPEARASLERALANVRRELGLDATGEHVATDSLLDRKVVAKVVNAIRDATGFDAWQELRTDGAQSLSSKGVKTTFAKVGYDVFVAETVRQHVQGAVDAIANPSDGKMGVVLGEKATKFLMDLVERDVRDPDRRMGVNMGDVAQGIRDFTSPYLAITLQAFNLNSHVLSKDRPSVNIDEQSALFLAGSPRNQRADRADVALSLLADASPSNRGPDSCFALALVSEKMTEMRRLQPKGRLTGATVWKACFGESVPKDVTDGFGSRAFSDAFFKRLYRLGNDVLARSGGLKLMPGMKFSQTSSFFMTQFFSGMGFTAGIRLCAEDPTFKLDASRDFVAAPPLYAVADAQGKTDAGLRGQLMADFYRDTPVIRLHDGANEESFDFAAAYADVHQDEKQPVKDKPKTPQERFKEKVNAFAAAFDAKYASKMTEIQRKMILLGLTQAGFAPFAAIEQLKKNAHTKMSIDIRREDDGAFVITYATDRDRKDLDVRFSYRIEPDGTNFRGNDLSYSVTPDKKS